MLMEFVLPHWLHSNENDKKKNDRRNCFNYFIFLSSSCLYNDKIQKHSNQRLLGILTRICSTSSIRMHNFVEINKENYFPKFDLLNSFICFFFLHFLITCDHIFKRVVHAKQRGISCC